MNLKKSYKGGLNVTQYMKIFTIQNGKVTDGASVQTLDVTAGLKIPAVIIGSNKEKCDKLGVLPVTLKHQEFAEWEKNGAVMIYNAALGFAPIRLISSKNNNTLDQCIVVFRTQFGFRGRTEHTGDKKYHSGYFRLPGRPLVTGKITSGGFGRQGAGQQIIAQIPQNQVFRTAYTGLLFGEPNEHYYIYKEGKIISVTGEERAKMKSF